MAKRTGRDKLLAEWFWTDRWMGSSAFLLPQEPRGVYREMLTQSWMRGARLPNDHEAIRRATGTTPAEWRRCWPIIERYWRVEGEYLVNDTQVEVYAEAKAAAEAASERGRRGAQARAQAQHGHNSGGAQAEPEQKHKDNPPSPSPSRNDNNDPPSPPARAGGPAVNGNGHGYLTKGEQDQTARELSAYWRWLASCDPRAPGGWVDAPASYPPDANVRAWKRALRDGRLKVQEIKAGIAERVRKDLTELGIPVWNVEPWPPPELTPEESLRLAQERLRS